MTGLSFFFYGNVSACFAIIKTDKKIERKSGGILRVMAQRGMMTSESYLKKKLNHTRIFPQYTGTFTSWHEKLSVKLF